MSLRPRVDSRQGPTALVPSIPSYHQDPPDRSPKHPGNPGPRKIATTRSIFSSVCGPSRVANAANNWLRRCAFSGTPRVHLRLGPLYRPVKKQLDRFHIPAQTARLWLHTLVHRVHILDQELATLNDHLERIVRAAAPTPPSRFRINTRHASQFMVTAGKNIGRWT